MAPTPLPGPPAAPIRAILAVAMGFSVVGFLHATDRNGPQQSPLVTATASADANSTRQQPTYADERRLASGVGMDWNQEMAVFRGPARTDAVTLAGTDKATDLRERAQRRAFDGAPPTIPHPIRQNAVAECLGCHEQGLRLRDRTAHALSHDAYSQCTQCHVVSSAPMPGHVPTPDAAAVGNLFQGDTGPTQGPRAWSGAPPVVPHRTLMRENCMSCHGPNGRDALRSTHPDRQQCEQCHASQAARNLGIFTEQRP